MWSFRNSIALLLRLHLQYTIRCQAVVVLHLLSSRKLHVMRYTIVLLSLQCSGGRTVDSWNHKAILHVTQLHTQAIQTWRSAVIAAGSLFWSDKFNVKRKTNLIPYKRHVKEHHDLIYILHTVSRWANKSKTRSNLIIKVHFSNLTLHHIA